MPIISNGPTPSSLKRGCSPYTQPIRKRDTPDEESHDWRAVCGRTARTVRREGRPKPSLPLSWRRLTGRLQPEVLMSPTQLLKGDTRIKSGYDGKGVIMAARGHK